MQNIIVAASNLYGLRAIHTLLLKKHIFGAISVGLSMGSSILYHLAEHTKHNMPGIKMLKKWESVLLNFDRIFAMCSILYFVIIKHNMMLNSIILSYGLVGILAGLFSEQLHYSKLLNKIKYPYNQLAFIGTHILWHFCVFHIAHLLA